MESISPAEATAFIRLVLPRVQVVTSDDIYQAAWDSGAEIRAVRIVPAPLPPEAPHPNPRHVERVEVRRDILKLERLDYLRIVQNENPDLAGELVAVIHEPREEGTGMYRLDTSELPELIASRSGFVFDHEVIIASVAARRIILYFNEDEYVHVTSISCQAKPLRTNAR